MHIHTYKSSQHAQNHEAQHKMYTHSAIHNTHTHISCKKIHSLSHIQYKTYIHMQKKGNKTQKLEKKNKLLQINLHKHRYYTQAFFIEID